MSHKWASPPRIQTQGCWAWTAAKLHILTVKSSEAEATINGLSGDVAKSLMPYAGFRIKCCGGLESDVTTDLAMAHERLGIETRLASQIPGRRRQWVTHGGVP
jgi:hypothetical protein